MDAQTIFISTRYPGDQAASAVISLTDVGDAGVDGLRQNRLRSGSLYAWFSGASGGRSAGR